MNIDKEISRVDKEIKEADELLNRLKAKKKQIELQQVRMKNRAAARERERERKARAHRLIVLGAETEKALGTQLNEAEAKVLGEILTAQTKVAKKYNNDFVTVIKNKASNYVTK